MNSYIPKYGDLSSQNVNGSSASLCTHSSPTIQMATWLTFASPIFTYYGQATTKNGVVADEHAIAYSLEKEPQLVPGEAPLRKAPIPIVTEENNRPLVPASRIYFAIHHPIQYNVKVKNLGHVHPDYLPTFLGYWNQENSDSMQDSDVALNANNTGNS